MDRSEISQFYVGLDIFLCCNDLKGENPREMVWEWFPATVGDARDLIVPDCEREVLHAPLLLSFGSVLPVKNGTMRVFNFGPIDVEELILRPDHPTRHIHHKANSIGSGHATEDHDYLHAVAEAVADAGEVLITGPANAKTELVKHIHHHHPELMSVVVGVETVDHPSDAQLVAYARKYFKATDRMQPQKP